MAQVEGIFLDLSGLQAIERHIEARAAKLVLQTAEEIVSDTKSASPVDTGNLRRSYHREQKDQLTQEVGTDVGYAPYVEFGTSKMAAQPHFVPAVERGRKRMTERAGALFGTSGRG